MSQPKEITVSVSKKLGRPGEFSSDSVLASITVSVDEGEDVDLAYVGAWEIVWKEANKQEDELKAQRQTDEAKEVEAVTPPTPDPIMDVTAPVCPIHKVQFEWHPAGVSKKTGKGYAGFYACPGKNPDGTYCRQKPATNQV